jgi:hypothetical protein
LGIIILRRYYICVNIICIDMKRSVLYLHGVINANEVSVMEFFICGCLLPWNLIYCPMKYKVCGIFPVSMECAFVMCCKFMFALYLLEQGLRNEGLTDRISYHIRCPYHSIYNS